jgi:uracil-DNA glycosylase family 4
MISHLHFKYLDDLYLEVMPHSVVIDGVDAQMVANERAILCHKVAGIKLLATNDAHYVRSDDYFTHMIFKAVGFGKSLEAFRAEGNDFGNHFFMRNILEMVMAYKALGYMDDATITQGIVNTQGLADKCNVEIPKFTVELPAVHENDELVFMQLCIDGWNELIKGKVGPRAAEYHNRLIFEISVIKKMDFVRYFLMVQDSIKWARDHDIMVGPARGSAAGSLVCFLMGITQVDPIKHGLYFERFLNPERVGLPDIDVDFQDDRRQEVFDYITNKYGADKVGHITTFSVLSAKSAFHDVARAFGINTLTANLLSKQIENEDSFDTVPDLISFKARNAEVVEQTKRLVGTIRQAGQHACIAEGSHLLTEYGYVPIDGLDGQAVRVVTKNGLRNAKVFCNGVRNIYRVDYARSKYSRNKRNIKVTADHLVGTSRGFMEAVSLEGFLTGTANVNIDNNFVMAGWFWGDGDYNDKYRSGHVYFTPGKDDDALKLFAPVITDQIYSSRSDKKRLRLAFVEYCERVFGGGFKLATYEKKPPVFVGIEEKIGWLRGYVSANATVQHGTIRIKIASRELLEFVKRELMGFGIESSGVSTIAGKLIEFKNGTYQCRDSHCIEISNGGAFLYANLIGFIQKHKNAKVFPGKFMKPVGIGTCLVYDFSVESENEDDKNGYVDGLLVHNCGLVVSSTPLQDVCVLEKRNKDFVTCWGKDQVEKFGLLKVDILGLGTLGILNYAKELVKRYHGVDIVYTEIPLDDAKTLEIFKKGDGVGVFQFENSGMQNLLKSIHVNGFEDVTAVTALYRPGSLNSGQTRKYVGVDKGHERESYLCPQLEPILKPTKSVMVYQEQIMRIFNELGGFSWAGADTMRKIIGKKLGAYEFNKHKIPFIEGCARNGISEDIASTIFKQMAEFAEYSFNKSHAVAYTMISWWCAYLKANYPIEFYTASLTGANDDKTLYLVSDAARFGIKVDRPDINISTDKFIIDDGVIVAPIGCIKGVGEKALAAILEARKAGVFLSLDDFTARVNKKAVNSKVVGLLLRAGAFERLGYVEVDSEQRNKNYCELLPYFSALPMLEHVKLMNEVIAHAWGQSLDYYEPFCGSETASIMIINNAMKQEKAHLTNKGTKYLQQTLYGLGFKGADLYYTSPVKCIFEDPKKISKAEQSWWPDILRREIAIVRPRLIICCASEAIPVFVGDGKMSKLQGKVIYDKKYDAYVLFSYSPQYAYFQPEKAGEQFSHNMEVVRKIFL